MISHLDHLVLTTSNLGKCIEFYTCVLGMELQTFGANRKAFVFGNQKINLHEVDAGWEPKAAVPTSGSLDLCFITKCSLDDAMAHLRRLSIDILEGPVLRTGASGPIRSVYIRDPDMNLIEISELCENGEV